MKLSSEWVISLVAPHQCLGCGREGTVCCEGCQEANFIPMPSRCFRCRRLTGEFAVCRSCRSPLRHVWVATEYDGLARQLLHGYKFQRARAAAATLAQNIAETLPYLSADTTVTYVPTATKRMRMRGYDHAELIAQSVASLKSLPFQRLVARQTQSRQVGANRSVRLKQLEGAFRLVDEVPERVLIVDDVVTTGATLEAMAVLLRRAGARDVSAAVFAQKL
jgi:ComF family protein